MTTDQQGETTVPRHQSRRRLLTAAATAGAAAVAATVIRPHPARAGDGDPVVLGASNSATSTTTINGGSNPQPALAVLNADGSAVKGTSGSGIGVHGETGGGTGVYGLAGSPGGYGVEGSGPGIGVRGGGDGGPESIGVAGVSDQGVGVQGFALNSVGVVGRGGAAAELAPLPVSQIGVWGYTEASVGVYGQGNSGVGVQGLSQSSLGVSGSSDTGTGVVGASKHQVGVFGLASLNNSPTYPDKVGVWGFADIDNQAVGVRGQSPAGRGVFGTSETYQGVVGGSVSGFGVYGYSETDAGVFGQSVASYGVVGNSSKAAVVGLTGALNDLPDTASGVGVWGYSFSVEDAPATGVLGQTNVGTAGRFVTEAPDKGIALHAVGRVKLEKSAGIATVRKGAKSVKVTPGIDIQTTSIVVATLLGSAGGTTTVHRVSVGAISNTFTIYLTANASAAVRVAWLILG